MTGPAEQARPAEQALPNEQDSSGDHDPELATAVREIEAHVAAQGWDRPSTLYALVDTGELLTHQPDLAEALGKTAPADGEQGEGADRSAAGLTPIEQEALAPGEVLEEVLAGIVWPPTVAGAAAVVERIVLPPEADGQIPEDADQAEEFAREHPDREEVRIVAGVTRSGSTYCALRLRAHDDDASVVLGADLVPNLLQALAGTLIEPAPEAQGQEEWNA